MPWASSSMPEVRSGPPYLMTAMIEAEPAVAGRILERLSGSGSSVPPLAALIRESAGDGQVVVTGCGTSEHAAIGVAVQLAGAWREARLHGLAPVAAQAFELALDPPGAGLVIGVSHEGATWATNNALAAAKAAGARTALITVTALSPGASIADVLVTTEELDQSWCHTVGYLSPLVAGALVAARLSGADPDAGAVRDLLDAGLQTADDAESLAGRLASSRPILTLASGADRPAARELVLKIEEGTWIPAAYRDLETFLHGHLAATDASTGLVLIVLDRADREQRVARARQALAAARAIGIQAAAILAQGASAAIEPELTPAGRLVVPEADRLPSATAAILGSAIPLQLLAERLARARGVNPDPIRRQDERYLAAAEAAESH